MKTLMTKKRTKAAVFTICLLFALAAPHSCSAPEDKITALYLTPASGSAFEKSENGSVYYYDGKKDDILALTVRAMRGGKLVACEKEPVTFTVSADGKTIDADDFIGRDGNRIMETGKSSAIIRISRIDTLGDYTLTASADGISASFMFSVDTKSTIADNLSLYYVHEIGDPTEEDNLVAAKTEHSLTLASSAIYAVRIKEGAGLGRLTLKSQDDRRIHVSGGETDANDCTIDENGTAYIAVMGKDGSRAVISMSAGSKVKEDFYIDIQEPHSVLTSAAPPEVAAIPVIGGYDLIFTSADPSAIRKYELMVRIDDGRFESITEKTVLENGNEAFRMRLSERGDHTITAYFQRNDARTESVTRSISLQKDTLLDDMNASDLLAVSEYPQEITPSSWNSPMKTKRIRIRIPRERLRVVESVPLSESGEFDPYGNAEAFVTIVSDRTEYVTRKRNGAGDIEFSYDMDSEMICDKVSVTVSLREVSGMTAGDPKSFEVKNERQNVSAEFEYVMDDESNAPKGKYAITISGNPEKDSSLYYSVSTDGGHSFRAPTQRKISSGIKKVEIDDTYAKNSKNVVFRAAIVKAPLVPYFTEDVAASDIKVVSWNPTIGADDGWQDKPNVRQVCIVEPTSPKCDWRYAITDGPELDGISISAKPDGYSSASATTRINVIKCDGSDPENLSEKTRYLWLKAVDPNNPDSVPAIKRIEVTLPTAPNPIQDTSDKALFSNVNGIRLKLTSPCDGGYIRAKAQTKDSNHDDITGPLAKGESKMIIDENFYTDYKGDYNKFCVAAYTRKNGYMDSRIDTYSGYVRSGNKTSYEEWDSMANAAKRELLKDWRLHYAM